MSMRVLGLLIALVMIGNVEALATAPQIVDPGDDLFEQKPPSLRDGAEPSGAAKPFQGAPARPDAMPDARPEPRPAAAPPSAVPAAALTPGAAALPEPAPNPLWAIPMSRLTETRNRPVFSQTRRPRPLVPAMKPLAAAPAPKPFEPEKPPLSLVGTVAGSEGGGIGLFVNTADKSVVRLKAGENHRGWVLRMVRPHQVELAKGLDSAVLDLPPPDLKSAAAPVAGLQPAVPPPMPSPPANASMPGSGAGPTTAALPGAGQNRPMLVVQPPGPNATPMPLNPFRYGRRP
jgi:general secretion pathway protein N